MATANNPENQQPQGGATDLGQISIQTNLQYVLAVYRRRVAHDPQLKPLPFCVVRDFGTKGEALVGNFSTWRNAMHWIERNCTDDTSHLYDVFQYTDKLELTQEWTK